VKTVGVISTTVVTAAAVVAAVVAVRSIPDVRRYLRIRSM
jgi:hypothetical protein